MAMLQRRFHAMRRKSSGVYFLPGSIATPHAVVERRPHRDVDADALTVDILRNPDRQHDTVSKAIAVDRIVRPQVRKARQSERQAGKSLVRVETAAGLLLDA